MPIDKKIQDYLDGLLTEVESKNFESELLINQDLRAKYEACKTATQLSKGLLEIDLQSTLEQAKIGVGTSVPQQSEKSAKPNYLLVPMLLLVLGIVGYFIYTKSMQPQESPAIFADVYKEPIWPVTRQETDSLSLVISSFLSTKDVNTEVNRLRTISTLDSDLKNYWISEMFTLNEVWDSVKVNLPALPNDHIKYDRVQVMKQWIVEYGR